jgi:hypothetical protein
MNVNFLIPGPHKARKLPTNSHARDRIVQLRPAALRASTLSNPSLMHHLYVDPSFNSKAGHALIGCALFASRIEKIIKGLKDTETGEIAYIRSSTCLCDSTVRPALVEAPVRFGVRSW